MASVDIAIMTPLPEEWEEMVKHLAQAVDVRSWSPAKKGLIGNYSVLCEIAGKGQEEMSSALMRTLERATPSMVFLVGIAGGFPAMNVHRGDVVVAHTVHSFDYGKLREGKFIRRPENDYNCDRGLLEFANLLARSEGAAWQRGILQPRPDSKNARTSQAHTDCYLASSNKVVDDPDHEFYAAVVASFAEIHAVETEAVGAGASIRLAQTERQLSFLVIRGISDEPGMAAEGGSTARQAWRRYASSAAAAFTRNLIESIPRKEPPPPASPRLPPSLVPLISSTYIEWLKNQCASVELLGLTRRQGLSVRLGNIYVPPTTTPGTAMGAARPSGPDPVASGLSHTVEGEFRDGGTPTLLLDRLGQSSLYVPGAPGSGKSTFCRRVAWLVCDGRMPLPDVEPPKGLRETLPASLKGRLPLLVRLREFWGHLPAGNAGVVFKRAELETALARWIGKEDMPGLSEIDARAHFEYGRVLLILDGIDEVPPEPRSLLLAALSAAVRVWHMRGHRLLVTSRPYALTPEDEERLSLEVAPIQLLGQDGQRLLVARWFRILEETYDASERTAADLLAEIERRDYIRDFARNPLLLTAVCIVYGQGNRLPQNRHELYHEIVNTVIYGRILEGERANVLNRLVAVAYGMHTGAGLGEKRPRETPQYEVTYAEIDRILRLWLRRESRTEADATMIYEAREELITRTGLLPPAHGREKVAFYHPSIQEFLAAWSLFDLADTPGKLRDLFVARGRVAEWGPTLSFVFGRVLATRTESMPARLLLTQLIRYLRRHPDVFTMLVAMDAFEILLKRGGERDKLGTASENRFRNMCLTTMRSAASARERCRFGDALAVIGDRRFRADAWCLPDDPALGFVEVPGGPFRMGSDPAADPRAIDDERPAHEVDLPAFFIARFPVTVAQFAAFVEDSGVESDGRDRLRSTPNHPVVAVSWYAALEYCRWLTTKLIESETTPESLKSLLHGRADGRRWQVTLPSEAEWEKAARGIDGRIYPWGDYADPDKANYEKSRIGGTSAVGCFPAGSSPYRIEEMIGNVWEWTRSLRAAYPYAACDGRESLAAGPDVRRVVRGGSFSYADYLIRAARRMTFLPAARDVDVGFRVVVSRFTSEL